MNVTFFFIRKGIDNFYYRGDWLIICNFNVKQTVWIHIPEDTEDYLITGLIKNKRRSPNYFFLFTYTLMCKVKRIASCVTVKLYK